MKKIFSTFLFLVAGMAAYAQDAAITVDAIKVAPGEEGEVVLNITGAQNYIAAGLYITIPENFKFLYDDEEEAYCYGGSVFAKTHSIADNLQADNIIKLAITSLKNAAFKNDEGTLTSAKFLCPESATVGSKYDGAIKKIEFSKNEENGGGLFEIADVPFEIEIIEGVSIEAISADEAISEVYSVSGAQQNGLQKGVNIVKYANGEVKKVVVK